jgi:hypothetical protein
VVTQDLSPLAGGRGLRPGRPARWGNGAREWLARAERGRPGWGLLNSHVIYIFPLGRAWLADQLDDAVEFRTRDELTWARDAWESAPSNLGRLGGNA